MMTSALMLSPGPYQVIVHLPWNGEDVSGIVGDFKAILSQPPQVWPTVEWHPQEQGLGPPPVVGPAWK
jgi:hypothetical protein